MPSSQITESPECSCTPYIPGEQILSYHTSAQIRLPVKYRIIFKIILITFKAIHGLALAYISEPISVRDTRRYDFRSNDGLLLAPCRGKTLTTLGDRSFHAAAPKLWNDLPGSIRNTQSLNKFKKAIKTVLSAKFYLIVSNFIFLHFLSDHFLFIYLFILFF